MFQSTKELVMQHPGVDKEGGRNPSKGFITAIP
jgi:hypothetical protein